MRFALMMPLADRIDRLNTAIGRAAAWLALAIVFLQFALVVARYLFGFGSIWLSETVIYANAALFMLAAAWTLRAGSHVRVDVFYAEAGPRTKAAVDLLGALLLLLPFALVLLWFAAPYAARSWAILERSQETSGLPLVFVLKTLIPLFAVLMALQGVAQAIRAYDTLFEKR
ncbi:MAG: TRAP transporter small permease subunit [Pseudolabrys sp.]